ncbi:unnamed protein product [Arabis nemorensis]|uniref:Uncharacterized protein n=1 Tax=Arabis nemorensis TaxID=586526 RepID=A0A565CLS4_9BRAS|nr:unnamed protein product [Arabis nemorensis]
MKCHESLLYIAAGSSVVSIDLRTMQKANTIAVSLPKINSFAMVPSSSLFCTGGDGKAMLWDTRRSSSKAVAEMVGHKGRIRQLHMDQYKIVTGGPEDVNVNVWETDTGVKANSLECCDQARLFNINFSAMAVQGLKLVTCGDSENIFFRDFYTATLPISTRVVQSFGQVRMIATVMIQILEKWIEMETVPLIAFIGGKTRFDLIKDESLCYV